MLLLTGTGDKLQLVTDSAANVDVYAAMMDYTPQVTPVSPQVTAIASATTTDIVAAPISGSITRNVKTLHIRNKHASTGVTVTVIFDRSGTDYELYKVALLAGDALEYIEGVGFFTLRSAAKLFANLRVATDVINATTSFADITGLTCPVKSGKQYNFSANLFYLPVAATSAPQFGINGPTMAAMRITQIGVFLGSVSAATMTAPAGDITALDTPAVVQINSGAIAVTPVGLFGWINPSADGTFAMRVRADAAVATAVTIKAGSYCQVWEADQ